MGYWWNGAAREFPRKAGRQRCDGRAGEAGQQSEQAGGISQITRETSGSSAFDLMWVGGGWEPMDGNRRLVPGVFPGVRFLS